VAYFSVCLVSAGSPVIAKNMEESGGALSFEGTERGHGDRAGFFCFFRPLEVTVVKMVEPGMECQWVS